MELKHHIPLLLHEGDRVSPAATIRLAWAITLSQYVDSTEVAFGTLETGENFPAPGTDLAAKPVILPLRLRLQFDRTVEEEIQSIWDEVQRILVVAPMPQSSNRLEEIQSSEWYNHSLLSIRLPGQNKPLETASYLQLKELCSLLMACELGDGSFEIRATFDQDVVTEWQTSRIMYQFAHVLQQINKSQNSLLVDLTVLSPEDTVQLRTWNGKKPQEVESCVHELIKKQSLERPEALAVCSWDGNFTYGRLEELSSSLSTYLISLGVTAEVFVPLYFEKSRWTTVAMVAVIKAGGAFLLLDPSHPLQRLQDMCEVVQAKLVLSSTNCADTASSLASSVILVGDKEVFPTGNGGNPMDVLGPVNPRSSLCVAFTSGSTGKPKGVVLEHGGFCSMSLAFGKALSMNHETRVFQFASYAFDASILENLTTLISGGCVCVPSEEDRRGNIEKALNEFKVNWGFFTPSVLKLIRADSVPTLQTITIGGERVPAADFENWVKRLAAVFIVYGPTECCPFSSLISLANIPPNTFSIGHGRGTVLWIVDRNNHDKLMPIGAVGELLIEGPSVGREYVNEPQKTIAAFIKDPEWLKSFRNNNGHRLYKTGDLVRYNADGSLQYISRKDTQVKIRGQRVELGEIEHQLQKNFRGATTVVVELVAPRHQAETSILIAFVSVKNPTSATGSDAELFVQPWVQFEQECVRAEMDLCACLPKYMVPAVFIPLSKVPLTLTGKIDRRLLRDKASGMSRDELGAFAVLKASKKPPTTDSERTLQRLVAQVLHLSIENFGMDDNFLHIGGDSLSAMKLVRIAREDAQISLSVLDVLGSPKLSDILVKSSQETNNNSPSLNGGPTECRLPWEPLGFLDPETLLLDTVASGIPSLSEDNILHVLPTTQLQQLTFEDFLCDYFMLHLSGDLDGARLEAACEALVQQHSILRTLFLPYKGALIQVVLKYLKVPFLRQKCDSNIAGFVETLCTQDAALPIPPGVSSLQFTLVTRNSAENTLIIRLSHAQYDGTSIGILFKNLADLYEGKQISVPVDFPTYIYHIRTHISVGAFSFWRNILRGSSMTYVGDMFHDTNQSQIKETLVLANKTFPIVKAPPGITLATLVKAAWSLTLMDYSGRGDVVFGQIVNGRAFALEGVDRLVGPCLNEIPVRVKEQSTWKALDLLTEIQNQHIQTMAFDTLGFKEIFEHSTPWPKKTKMGSTLLHQNSEDFKQFKLGSVNCTTTQFWIPQVSREFSLVSTPHETELEIQLFTSNVMMDEASVNVLLEKVCGFVVELALSPDKLLSEIRK